MGDLTIVLQVFLFEDARRVSIFLFSIIRYKNYSDEFPTTNYSTDGHCQGQVSVTDLAKATGVSEVTIARISTPSKN